MVNDDLIQDDDAFLNALVDEALADDDNRPTARYTHAYVDAVLHDVLQAIPSGFHEESYVECNVFGASSHLSDWCVYMARKNGGTVLWFPQKSLTIAASISRKLARTVHWVSVYENANCRAYLRFDDGRCTKELLDPTYYWNENILEGDDLVGKGRRKFRTYESFLDALKGIYVPVDSDYDFERIDQEVVNENGLVDRIGPIVKVSAKDGCVDIDFFGNWPEHERRAIEALLNEN